jgi:hypothetical protein
MYRLAQIPKMIINNIRNRAMGFKMRTRNFESRGAYRDIRRPMDKGMTKQKAYTHIL